MTLWTKLVLLLLLVGGAITAISIQTMRLAREQAAHARTKESYAAAQLAAEQDAAKRLKAQQTTVDQSRRSLDEARQKIRQKDADLASARIDVGRLRDQLKSYSLPTTSCPTCNSANLAELAGSCGDLLERGRGLVLSCARDHDERSAEVKALVEAWPK